MRNEDREKKQYENAAKTKYRKKSPNISHELCWAQRTLSRKHEKYFHIIYLDSRMYK